MMYEIVLGTERLVVQGDQLTVAKSRELRASIKKVAEDYDKEQAEIKKALNDLNKEFSPRLERYKDDNGFTETYEEWEERIAPILEERDKKVNEISPPDDESHLQMLAFRCLEVIGRLFGQERKVTRTNFDNAVWEKTCSTLAKMLITHQCDMGVLFLPPKNLG